MEARIHSLEDAIAIVRDSNDTHPVLRSLAVEEEEEEPILKPVAEEAETAALVDALGTLHVDPHGAARFFGPSGGSESLLLKAKDLQARLPSATRLPLQELDSSCLPSEINHCYQAFPFTPSGIEPHSVQSMIETFLPSIQRATILCDTFLEHLSWMFHIVSRWQLFN